jgi:NAD+ diphosphatase
MSELNLSPIDRGSDLRTDATKLEQLWNTAQIIHLVDSRVSATDDALTFITAQGVSELLESFIEGERFFLGTSREDNQP